MKLILIPVSDRPECAIALHHGFTIGKNLSASVVGCHIRPHSNSEVDLPGEPHQSILSLDSYDLAWETALKEHGDTSIEAHDLYNKLAKQYDFKCSKKFGATSNHAIWSERVGAPDRLFNIIGPIADLIIVSRPNKKGRSKAKTIMISALMNSATSVLVLPQKEINSLGKNISIAWNQSKESMQAVKAALPLLQQAESVNIITCGPENSLGPKSKQLRTYLKSWGIVSDHIALNSKGNDIEAVLDGYHQTNSDLLVMGAYSRSRLRQQVFGGFTEYMLHEADIPVIMLHA